MLKHALWVALLLMAVRVAHAEAPLFVWADSEGHVHATDRLGDVPEPYHSMYEARIVELKKRGKTFEVEAPPAEPPAPPPVYVAPPHLVTAAEVAARRQYWRDLVARWRTELKVALALLVQLEQAQGEQGFNPILRETPQVKQQLAAREPALQNARARVVEARHMLLDVLPKKAHDEHVPPVWLQ